MRRKLFFLISFALVLAPVLLNSARGTEPNLVGWWKFDETSGTTASESTGYVNPSWPVSGVLTGTLNGTATWATGYRGNAVQLNGTSGCYVSFPLANFGDLVKYNLKECTLSIWVYWSGTTMWQRIFDIGSSTSSYIYLTPYGTLGLHTSLVAGNGIWDECGTGTGNQLSANRWHHIAVTVSDSSKTMRIYLDGNPVASKTTCTNSVNDMGRTGSNWLGRSEYTADPYFSGLLDDFKIYDRVLTQANIRRIADPEKASIPVPADGSSITQTSPLLQWQAGIYAATTNGHHVYFGNNFSDVNTGAGGTDKGLQTATSYQTNSLSSGATYYWRVDEVNGVNTWKGRVWNFVIPPLKAYNPNPANDANYIDPNANLSWSAGSAAKYHDVYFGTIFNDVNNATRANPLGVLKSQGQSATTYDPGKMAFGTTFYWRIDEVNGTNIWKGDVWHFQTGNIQILDPTLVGWWKFDDGAGTRAIDSSGYYRHGTLYGPAWTDGRMDGAIQFDATNDYASLPVGQLISTLDSATIAAWVDFNDGDAWQRIFSFGTGTSNYIYLTASNTDGYGPVYAAITNVGSTSESTLSSTTALAAGWHHVALVLETGNFALYIDAQLVAVNYSPLYVLSDLGVTTDNWLGRSEWPNDPYFDGSMDDFRIYNRVLSEEEIRDVITPPEAWLPNPVDNATGVYSIPTLSWEPGRYAADVDGHKLYFSDDFNNVNERTVAPITLTDPQYTIPSPPAPLESLKTYYWAVDEVNSINTWPGDVWRFTIRDKSVIDDFEQYITTGSIPPEAGTLRRTWIDGLWPAEWYDYPIGPKTPGSSGSYAQLNTDTYDDSTNATSVAQSGTKSMKFYYDNDGTITWLPDLYGEDPYYTYTAPKYSEVSAAIDDAARLDSPNPPFDPNAQDSLNMISRDWSSYTLLKVPVFGDSNNTIGSTEKLYVGLKDGDGTEVTIYNSDPNMVKQHGWHNWYIPLANFPAQNANLDLTNIARIYMGIGVRGNTTTSGGRGIVFFDDIQLIENSICVSGSVIGDFTADCNVNAADLQRMTELWLGQTPTMPTPLIKLDASGLALGTLSTWANTGSAGGSFNDFNSLTTGDNPRVATIEGKKAVVFDGNDILKATITAPSSITGSKPFTVIYNVWNLDIGSDEEVFCWAKRGTDARYAAACYSTGTDWAAAALWGTADVGFDRGSPAAHTWHTIAFTYKGGTDGPFYVVTDGQVNTSVTRSLDLWPSNPMTVGAAYEGDPDDANDPNITGGYFYSGALAKLEVYSVYVPPGNLAILMGTPVDMKKDNVIDFRDLAIFAKKWMLGPVLWP